METVINHYNEYDEEGRLTKDKAHKIEFITTTHFLDKYISEGSKVLDVGAGAGIYSLYYAKKGIDITAIDLSPKHVKLMREKSKADGVDLKVFEGNALNLENIKDNTYDVVLCLGPLYHLMTLEERKKCIDECKRVLKPQGVLAVAYISRFATFVNMINRDSSNINDVALRNISEIGKEFNNSNDCFYHSTKDEVESIMKENKLTTIDHIGTDGIGAIIRDRINSFNYEEFKYWLDYHFMTCNNENLIGYSQHGLYIGRK